MTLTRDDVEVVASNISIIPTEDLIDFVLEYYEEEDDPTVAWDLIVENLIYHYLNLN